MKPVTSDYKTEWNCPFSAKLMLAPSIRTGITVRHIFGVVDRDGDVSVAMPQADRALNGGVVQSRRRTHEPEVLGPSVCPVSGGFDEGDDGGLTNVGMAVQRAIHRRKIFVELTRKTFG